MDIRWISKTHAVGPQIALDDIDTLRAGGFVGVICNRPDGENPPELAAAAFAEHSAAAELAFLMNPMGPQAPIAATVEQQAAFMGRAEGPTFAYCASGTRSAMIWCLGHAQDLGADGVLASARGAGYDLEHLRPTLEALAAGAAL
ncbi:MAG: TIGR01244 family sulfur transferase [Pseudomonadota bacterium]